jgi:hypothetical protein
VLQGIKKIVLICIFAVYPQIVSADYGETFLYVSCDKKNKTFEIEPFIIWNEELDKVIPTVERGNGLVDNDGKKLFRIHGRKTIDVTCVIEDTTLRVLLPDNSKTLELYENNILVASPTIGYVWGMFGPIYQVRFKPITKWEEYCGRKSSLTKWKPLDLKRKNTNCKDSVPGSDEPFDALSKFTFDDGPMLFQTIVSTDDVCQIALKKINDNFLGKPSDFKDPFVGKVGKGIFITPNGHPYKEFTNPGSFDFDNDGIADQVFSYSGGGSYLLGDIFYVAYGDKDNSREKNKLSISDIHIFPCQFDSSVTTSSSCPTISQDADEAGINVSFKENNESVFFHGRYTNMTTIGYNDKTYIILQSNSQDTELYSAVIYPFEKTKFNSVCLFKRQP